MRNEKEEQMFTSKEGVQRVHCRVDRHSLYLSRVVCSVAS